MVFSGCGGGYFEDNKVINLLDYQDQRDSVEVANVAENSDLPNQIRQIAIEALGSMQPQSAKNLLMDIINNQKEPESIRKAALFSLGQYRDSTFSKSLISNFERESNDIQIEILKALGKMGGQQVSFFYASFDNEKARKYSESLALSLAYFSKNNVAQVRLIEQAIAIVIQNKYPASSFAANALSNWKANISEKQTQQIILAIPDLNPTAQFHALRAMLKWTKNSNINEQWINLKGKVTFENEHALIDLIDFKGKETVAFNWLSKGISHNSEIALANGAANWDVVNQNSLMAKLTFSRAQAKLYQHQLIAGIELKNGNDTTTSKSIIDLFARTTLLYDKGYVLLALGESWRNLPFLENEMNTTSDFIVRQKAYESILKVRQSKNYILFEQSWKAEFPNSSGIDAYFSRIINQAIGSRDVGLIAQSCELLLQKDLIKQDQLLAGIDTVELNDRLKSLQLPRDIEIYNLTLQVLAKFNGKTYSPKQTAYNNAMDWTYIKRLPKIVDVVFKTNKGNFEMACTTQLTPGTVAQFCRLVGKGFYDGKVFHRVVPNFVVQGGCPRGDGYGSTNETIRSEFTNQSFTIGDVGMASAGKDTESCQFFVMTGDHPHLDGRYTQFGKITEGMDVILKLEEGDYIIQADFKP